MAKLVAKTYSEALFEVALEENKTDLFLEELEFIIDTFKMYPEFFTIFKSPQISIEEKKNMMAEVFGAKLSKEMNNFVKILLDKNRSYYIEQINNEYETMLNNHKGIVKAVAITAIPLNDEDKLKLKEKIEKMTGKNIKITNKIDKSILGGVLVRIGDKVIDGTVKGRLFEIKESLSQIIV
jgi:F-type H+-transporting ATPase subunit delta